MTKRAFIRHGKFYVYILQCQDGTYYTGYTNDLESRLIRHNKGLASKYTRSRLPVTFKWSKRCKDKSVALKTEARLKKLSRKDKEALIQSE